VYRALTDPAQLRRWWGPRGFTVTSLEFRPRVGDAYRIAMQPPDGDLFHLCGEFTEVDPPGRLAFTFRWDPPHADDRQTLATLSLDDRGAQTGLRLVHGEFATAEREALHRAGWTDSLDQLEELLGSGEHGKQQP
jgi:uncharacterized protein YndB with AHSA1/START domain